MPAKKIDIIIIIIKKIANRSAQKRVCNCASGAFNRINQFLWKRGGNVVLDIVESDM